MGIFISILKRHRFLIVPAFVTAVILAGMAPSCVWAQGVFQLDIRVVDGGSSLDFGTFRSLDPNGDGVAGSEIRQVQVTVTSSQNIPYTLSQMVGSDIANQNGTTLPLTAVRFRIEKLSGAGIVRTPDMAPLKSGTEEIYLSDDNGGGVVLLFTYELVIPPGQRAGRYNTFINFRADTR